MAQAAPAHELETGKEELMKTCPICQTEKPLSEYDTYFSKERNKLRPQNYCKSCQPAEKRRRSKEYYERNKKERLEYAKQYRKENKGLLRIKKRMYKRIHIQDLRPCYVGSQASKVLGIPQKDIPKDMVQAYASIMKIKRIIRNEKQNERPQ